MRSGHPNSIRHQRGVTALFVTLIILVVMLILGITAALLSGTQFKLASNLQLENVAFNLAETAQATAQNWLITGGNYKDAGFNNGNYNGTGKPYIYPRYSNAAGTTLLTTVDDPLATNFDWDARALAITIDSSKQYSSDSKMYYFIQKVGHCQRQLGTEINIGGRLSAPEERADLYRVTALGSSVKGTKKILQSTYRMPIPTTDVASHCAPT